MADERATRILVVGVCAVLAWAFATYDFNVYLGRAHLVDRAALILLAAAVWKTPKAVALFLPYVLIVVEQFQQPLGTARADKTLLFKVLWLFVAYLIARAVTDVPGRVFVFGTGILVAGNLFLSGVTKIRIGWLANKLSHLFIASYENGFPGWLSDRSALRVADVLDTVNIVMLVGTLVVEIAFIALWWHRRAYPVLLVAGVLLHLSIFLSSGIFFWKWIVLEVLLLLVVTMIGWRRMVDAVGGALPAGIVSAILIVAAPLYADPVALAWFDTAVTYTFELRAVTPDGRVAIARHFFSPYEVTFSQNRFSYLTEKPTPVGTFATVSTKEEAERLNKIGSCKELDDFEAQTSTEKQRPGRARAFVRFVRRYVSFAKTPDDRGYLWRANEWIQAPTHIWVQTDPPVLKPGTEVSEVEVVRERTIHLDGRIERCEPELIGEIPIGGR